MKKKGESQELPIKNGTKSASDIFDGIEINVPSEVLKKGGGKNVPPATTTTTTS